MKIINASYDILTDISPDGLDELRAIELVARTCYKSEYKITEDGESAKKLVQKLIKNGHEAMLEHNILSVRFIVDRGISHELVRHRLASYAQESTRYCNYSSNQFENGIVFIKPCYFLEDSIQFSVWKSVMHAAEDAYFLLLYDGYSPQQARCVLPNSLKTEVIMTANYREWRHFFKLRTAKAAHVQMREVTIPLLKDLKRLIPIIFDDIEGGNV